MMHSELVLLFIAIGADPVLLASLSRHHAHIMMFDGRLRLSDLIINDPVRSMNNNRLRSFGSPVRQYSVVGMHCHRLIASSHRSNPPSQHAESRRCTKPPVVVPNVPPSRSVHSSTTAEAQRSQPCIQVCNTAAEAAA
jgi:hypothetical protein